MRLIQRLRDAVDALFANEEELEEIDTEFLRRRDEYVHLSVTEMKSVKEDSQEITKNREKTNGENSRHSDDDVETVVPRGAPTPGDAVRCNLCGQLFKLKKMPEAIEHVAAHDEQGSADIDPFEQQHEQTAMIIEDMF